jgi:hypothetical protein
MSLVLMSDVVCLPNQCTRPNGSGPSLSINDCSSQAPRINYYIFVSNSPIHLVSMTTTLGEIFNAILICPFDLCKLVLSIVSV